MLTGAVADLLEDGEGLAFALLERRRDTGDRSPIVGDEDAGEGVAASLGLLEFTGKPGDGGLEFGKFGQDGEGGEEVASGEVCLNRRGRQAKGVARRIELQGDPGGVQAGEPLGVQMDLVVEGGADGGAIEGRGTAAKARGLEERVDLAQEALGVLFRRADPGEAAHEFEGQDLSLLLEQVVTFLGEGQLAMKRQETGLGGGEVESGHGRR